jgi:glutamate synthase domain-containing protein 3
MEISAKGLHYNELNERIKASPAARVIVKNAMGHRYIGCASEGKEITVEGTPGNATGAYLNGSRLIVYGNAQDAIGDTMNKGEIVIYGNCGDTTGYGMRSGSIYIRGKAGYRVGIHMKEYQDLRPAIVIGKSAGDFLGEYQAGGTIIVLGIDVKGSPVGSFPATGMHGGRIFIRTNLPLSGLPKQVACHDATQDDMKMIEGYVRQFCEYFGGDAEALLNSHYSMLTPNSSNPYKQFYVNN